MSLITACNFCVWKAAEASAARRGATVKLESQEDGFIALVVSDSGEPNTWFMSVSGSCAC